MKDHFLELKIFLQEGVEPVHCLAKVCRVEQEELTLMFHIALYYLDIASADRARINEFVKNKLPKQESPTP